MEEMNNNFEQQQPNTEQPKCEQRYNDQPYNAQGFAQYDDPTKNGTYYNYQPFTAQPPYGYAQPQMNNEASASKGRLSMILGIISAAIAFMCSCFPVSIGLGIAAIILAVKSKKLSSDNKMNGMAIAGLACGIAGIVLGVFYLLSVGLLILMAIMFPEGFAGSAALVV